MTANIFICHTESNTQWVDHLVEFLETTSTEPAIIRCSYLPGYALSSEESDSDALRLAFMRSDVVVAVTSPDTLNNAQYMFELGAAWAFDRWIIPVMLPETSSEHLPKPIRDLPALTIDGPEAVVKLAQHVSVGYVESQHGQAALQRMFDADIQESETATSPDAIAEAEPITQPEAMVRPEASSPPEVATKLGSDATRSESFSEQRIPAEEPRKDSTQEGVPTKPPPPPADEFVPPQEEAAVETQGKKGLPPSTLDGFNAGVAFADCMFNREGTSSFSKELDGPLGSFIDALGGNWESLRALDDLDVFNGVTENLIASLPPDKSAVSVWYDIGARISTLLNIAGRGLPTDPQERESIEAKWNGSITSFRFLASQVKMQDHDIAELQAMFENLVGPESEKDYSYMAKCLERLRAHAAASEPK